MSKNVVLYGLNLNNVPVIGGVLASERFLRPAADVLSVSRIIGGPAIAGYILTHRPEERSWKAGMGVGLWGLTDKLDGDIIKALTASMTDQEKAAYKQSAAAKRGAFLDHVADKAFVVPPQMALASRGEIARAHHRAKIARDVGVSTIKSIQARESGTYASAKQLARAKTYVEMSAVAIGASPLAAMREPDGTTLTEYAFRAATALSIASGAQYAADLANAFMHARVEDVRELVIDGPQPA